MGKLDAFSGRDQPATNYVLPWTATAKNVADTFGKAVPAKASNGNRKLAFPKLQFL
ncbi:MAG: hypothetical protein ABI358_09990 [Ginsengibacter sp.]